MFRDDGERVLVFRVGAEWFAMPIATIDEVIDAPPIQRLPDAASTQLGVATLRGELVMVYDARPLLHASGSAADVGALLLFQRDGRRVGLAVDDVQDSMTIEEQDVRPVPGLDAADRTIVGLVRRGSGLIAILDATAVLDAAMSIAADGGERT
jgi:chemotaxis signal transduction protein